MTVVKSSISLPEEAHRWASKRAQREGTSLSTVVAEGLEELRRRQAWKRVRDKLLKGAPLTELEIAAALAELQS